jgi:hypothetical protein
MPDLLGFLSVGGVDMLVPRYVTGDGSHDHTRTSRVPSSTVHTPRI